MNQKFHERITRIKEPTFKGSYSKEDCIFLLKDITPHIEEENNEIREEKMKDGIHYSEMLPVEHYPTDEYLEIFHHSLETTAPLMAQYVADVANAIVEDKGKDVVLVSLARAGTPIGVLIKRYLKDRYRIEVPHYSISIIRGKGIDENALAYIIHRHQTTNLQFVDGWTGKGMIGRVLTKSLLDFKKKYNIALSDDLAVLADPAHSSTIFGVRDDYFLPSSCLNSIVSGLSSRTVMREDLIGEYDFHGAKYYYEWENKDLSQFFIDEVSSHFSKAVDRIHPKGEVTHAGWKEMQNIKEIFGVQDMNKIKPGIGETTRVLLRRVPWKILIKDFNAKNMEHIFVLAEEKGVPLEEYPNMTYSCIGIIKE